MLLLYAEDRRMEAVVAATAPTGVQVRAARDWWAFEREAPCASALLVAADVDVAGALVRRLRRVRADNPAHALVLVTTPPRDDGRALVGLAADAVVWRDRVEQDLWPTVAAARANALLHHIAQSLAAAAHLPARLRHALADAVDTVPPPTTVAALAVLAQCHRATLGAQWRQAVAPRSTLRLEDFVSWLVLLRAVERKRHDQKWSALATDCDVHLHTLRRLARKLAGCRLADLEGSGRRGLYERFQSQCVAAVTAAVERRAES
jgi:hypothetical protein